MSASTRQDGRFEWRDAPGDSVFTAPSGSVICPRDIAMKADGAEAVITATPC